MPTGAAGSSLAGSQRYSRTSRESIGPAQKLLGFGLRRVLGLQGHVGDPREAKPAKFERIKASKKAPNTKRIV
jgi:hypothetical protein